MIGLVLGPIIGGFIGDSDGGWRWLLGMMTILTGFIFIVGVFFYPETYAPVLLRKRAGKLTMIMNGTIYQSKFEAERRATFMKLLKTSLSHPWILLFREPIVFVLSLYISLIYGVLYMFLPAFPIVYKQARNWSTGVSGLAFCGLAVGMFIAIIYTMIENNRYNRKASNTVNKRLPPEARLPPAIVGAFVIPVGLFWFAWTNSSSIHYMVSIAAGIPIGFGMVLVMISIFNYLIDSYVIHAASVLAANLVLRSIFGAVFPLFTPYMYASLGIHWAASLPGFLALICVPFPFIFYKYGARIRQVSKFTMKSQALLDQIVASTETNLKTEPRSLGGPVDATLA